MRLEEIAEKGDDLEALKALRQKIAQTIDSTESARDLPPLARRFQEVIEKIAELEEEQRLKGKGSVLDEVLQRHHDKRRKWSGDDYEDEIRE